MKYGGYSSSLDGHSTVRYCALHSYAYEAYIRAHAMLMRTCESVCTYTFLRVAVAQRDDGTKPKPVQNAGDATPTRCA